MGVTREDLERKGHWLTVSDEEWERQKQSVEYVTNCYLRNDPWAIKIKKNVGVLLTSSPSGLPYLKASLESHKKLGYWTVLAYDNYISEYDCPCPNANSTEMVNGAQLDINHNRYMPTKDVMNLVDTFLLPHHQCWGGVSYSFIWLIRLASGILHSFDYVLLNNGDMVLEKPEGFPKLLEMMGDADMMSSGPTYVNVPGKRDEIGTAGILFKSKALMDVAKHMNDHMVPFEEYEKSTQDFGNTEGRLAIAARDLGLKQVICKPGKCPHHEVCEQLHTAGTGDWYDIIGMRHIHGELNYAHRYGKSHFDKTGEILPVPLSSYLDDRHCGGEDIKAARAYEAGDIEFVKNWWAKD